MKHIFFIVFFIISNFSIAQRHSEASLNLTMDKGVQALDLGEYLQADSLFRVILEHKRVLPSELTYYFGKNSYFIKKYKQSINWLSKYVQLKGSKGLHFNDASKYLAKAEEKYRTETSVSSPSEDTPSFATTAQIVFVDEIECASDSLNCPVCNGSGVIVVAGKYEKIYKTCPYSGLKGFMSCEEYNLFMNGKLLESRVKN